MHLVDYLERCTQDFARELKHLPALLKDWIEKEGLEHPRSSIHLFKLLRDHKPILVLGQTSVVSKYADVVEALSHEDNFTVELYQPKMAGLAGLSTLAMSNTPEYQHDIAALAAAVRSEDLPRIADSASSAADGFLQAAKPSGQVNTVAMLRSVLNRLLADYFGAPGLDSTTQYYWVHKLYDEIFAKIGQEPLQEGSIAAAAAWSAYLLNLIAQRKAAIAAGDQGPGDVLQRLIRMQTESGVSLSDEKIAPNLIYMTVGFVPNVLRLGTLALDELLERPAELVGAQQAARENNDDLLNAYLFEALRFNPPTPALVRKTPVGQSYTLAAGSTRAATIPGGSTVFVALQSAMQDEDMLPDPGSFRVDRPRDHYLYFGSGLHTCLGRHVGSTVVTAALKPLLQQHNLRRAPGADGLINWDGPFPASLKVNFN